MQLDSLSVQGRYFQKVPLQITLITLPSVYIRGKGHFAWGVKVGREMVLVVVVGTLVCYRNGSAY